MGKPTTIMIVCQRNTVRAIPPFQNLLMARKILPYHEGIAAVRDSIAKQTDKLCTLPAANGQPTRALWGPGSTLQTGWNRGQSTPSMRTAAFIAL